MKKRLITGSKWTTKQIVDVLEAIDFGIKYYEIEDTGTLTIKLINDDSLAGTADRIKNRRFEIRLTWTEDIRELLCSVFHEVTHINQFINKEFRFMGGRTAKWKGKEYPLESTEDYLSSPWEMEARASEELLYYLFEESR